MSLKNSKKIPQALSDILNKKPKEDKMTLLELKAQHPELINEFQTEILNSVAGKDTVKNAINEAVQSSSNGRKKKNPRLR